MEGKIDFPWWFKGAKSGKIKNFHIYTNTSGDTPDDLCKEYISLENRILALPFEQAKLAYDLIAKKLKKREENGTYDQYDKWVKEHEGKRTY